MILLLLLPLLAACLLGRLAWWWWLPYAVMAAPTLLVYWLDKRAALRGQWRIPEARLQWLHLAGGWPAAWLAQRAFRHKTRKQPFQALYWLSALANLALPLGWLWLRSRA
ncbi:DUF1294 domain-containing protein [Chromobacterium violaceum]|uniref:Cold-shock protein n=1 Tax=Chromobacterium violaceum (strain ATCC 12472 / DSM 30191 / JCM 1249 / CCUG 213 / NBRC 12614 / NCIMB 9131 / NCTC 9757 / MK) TaxID=243365 RepID=Q7P0R6_CHRVO|nr:DUF1294 domain-containing protein [Chromobacterium violaceum]AAQ58177.1 conserved hypothetical protein [Chromobacterium violaceum ATCC 12472]SUX40235.1 Protein of uncharacterised function (DUF1294) [Chromobacterium violaceum]